MKIISSKYLLDQEKKRRKEQEERIALEQKKIQQEQADQDKARFDQIREGLRLSYVAYNDYFVAEHYLKDHGFSNFLRLSSSIGTQGLCCLRDRKAYIAFRGTDSWPDILRDAAIDLLFIPWYRPTVHLGFGSSWRTVHKEVRKWLEHQKIKFDSIGLYGHSLGGAIAHVAALELAPDYEINEVVTFGAPRSSFLSTRDSYNNFQLKPDSKKNLGSVTLRVVNKLDLVSKVPFSWQGYHHVGNLVYLSTDGRIFVEDEAWKAQMNDGFLEPVFKLFEQENTALYHPSTSLFTSKPTPVLSPGFGTKLQPVTLGNRLLTFYRQAKLYIPLIQVPVQTFFMIIAPFIFLAGTLLYLLRSSKSHLKLDYANYFSDDTTQFEVDLENVKNELGIKAPSRFITFTSRFLTRLAKNVLIGSIMYLCYWLFTRWTWPLLIDWIQN